MQIFHVKGVERILNNYYIVFSNYLSRIIFSIYLKLLIYY